MSSQASKEIFCPLAWIHSFVNLGGEYQLCCTSEEYDNDILNEQGEPFKVTDKVDLKTLMNSKHMNAIRKKMLNGQWPNECRRCLSTEQLGGISRRNIEQKSYEHLNEQLLDQTNEDGSLKEINILSSDYRLGNHCNLQCRMCTPRATKNWIPHWLEVQPKSKYTESDLEYFKKMDWFESDDLIMDVERKSDTIEHLHFGGGEPLLSPKMKNILQTYIDKGRAKDIILTYNTNITRLPAHVLKLWPHFKEVRLLVSIDAYGELNDYIRPPSKWCEVDANLRFLNDNASDLKITQIMLNTTVQAYNILGLRDLCEYLEQFENVISLPNFILLHYPLYYQANIITNEQKEKAFEDLNFIYKRNFLKIPKNLGYLLKNILQIKNFIQVQPTDEQKEQFIQVTNKLDKIHGKILEDKWWR